MSRARVRPLFPTEEKLAEGRTRGLPGAAVREARERVRSGAASSGLPLPSQRITVSLAPADVRKESPGFDLPVALSVLAASGYLPPERLRRVGAVGELALDGGIRPVRGMLSVAESARADDVSLLLVPLAGLPEAGVVEGLSMIGVLSLAEAVAASAGPDVQAGSRTEPPPRTGHLPRS